MSILRSDGTGPVLRMVFNAALLVILLIAPAAATPARAAPDPKPDRTGPMTVVIVRDSRPGCASSCAEWVSAQGKIVPGTQAVFDRALHALGPRRLPIFIDSLGGSVPDALAIGRRIRARRLDVVVTRSDLDCGPQDGSCAGAAPDGARPGRPHGIGSVCASACVFILAAGEKREAAPWTLVGVHQIILNKTLTRTQRMFRVVSREENGQKIILSRTLIGERVLPTLHFTGAPAQAMYDKVSAYFADMGISRDIMPLVLATPPSGIHWLTADEQRSTSLITDRVDGDYVAAETEGTAGASAASPTMASLPEQAGLIIAQSAPAQPQTSIGRVRWFLDGADAAQAVLRADVDIPDAGLRMSFHMAKAAREAPIVAPMIDLAFTMTDPGKVRTIERIAAPQMRALRPPAVFSLAGAFMPAAGPNTYEIKLSDDEARSLLNEGMIAGRPWMDIPMLINGGTVAKLTFEHGASGTPLIEQAFRDWHAAAGSHAAPKS